MWGNAGEGQASSSSEAGGDIDIWGSERRAAWLKTRRQREKSHTMKLER